MRRRAIWQHGAAKWRMIDNAKTSGHNDITQMQETIVTATFDTPILVLRRLRARHGPLHPLLPLLGSEDIEDAYRKIPVLRAHQRFSVVACRQPSDHGSGLQYGVLSSMAFGLKAAVVNFNRVPAILIAALRRLFGVLVWHFFDDTGYFQMRSEDSAISASHFIE
eukprot:6456003-Amphidinium_carterae.1